MSRDRDLVHRTTAYASKIVRFFIALPRQREEVAVLGKQLLRSGTSVAANYRETARARSTGEYISKLGTACRRPTKARCGWNCLKKTAALPEKTWNI